MRPVMFVGPTAYGLAPNALSGFAIRPPVRRGDIEALLDESPGPGTIAVVDGTFHSYPSVGHAELRRALESGWALWGLSSMGAIRAAEMRHLGFRGYGDVYRRFVQAPNGFDDDEVTLLHEAEAPFRPLSEPLVHIRNCVASLTARGRLTEAHAAGVLDQLKHRWYADRTLPALRAALTEAGIDGATIDAELDRFARYRSKTTDLVNFVRDEPW